MMLVPEPNTEIECERIESCGREATSGQCLSEATLCAFRFGERNEA